MSEILKLHKIFWCLKYIIEKEELLFLLVIYIDAKCLIVYCHQMLAYLSNPLLNEIFSNFLRQNCVSTTGC